MYINGVFLFIYCFNLTKDNVPTNVKDVTRRLDYKFFVGINI